MKSATSGVKGLGRPREDRAREGSRRASGGCADLVVLRTGSEEGVKFAAAELARDLAQVRGREVACEWRRRYDAGPGLWVGVASHLDGAVPLDRLTAADALDDALFVDVSGNAGVISGSNGRSVLFAVYRYLEALGCRWFRPGKDGEFVPRLRALPRAEIRMLERPSARHRCICIEGACSIRHVRDMIDYAARRGFNAYFLQFRNAYTFFERWYGRENPNGRTDYTTADAARAWERAKSEARRRGILLHTVGHGWTCEPFGISGLEWAPTKQRIPPPVVRHLARIDGRRGLYQGTPLNTNLCYSSPRVRRIMAAAVADYAGEHPDEELVHVWLADGTNNQCECARCGGARPSDFYVQILNQIDVLLTARRLETRIVFLAYVDLLWAPQAEKIANPDRFTLMFAPITRSFTAPLLTEEARRRKPVARLPPYRRNRLVFPRDTEENLRFLDQWRRSFAGDCVDFDFHLMFDPTCDPSGMEIVPVLYRDLRDLGALEMDGYISAQRTRIAFPTGVAMHVMGHTLWNAKAGYRRLVGSYFRDLFGAAGDDAYCYLTRLGRLSMTAVLRGEQSFEVVQVRRKMAGIQGEVARFAPTIDANLRRLEGLPSRRREQLGYRISAWEILRHHAWYMTEFAALIVRVDPGNVAGTAAAVGDGFEQLESDSRRRCRALHHVFDGYYNMRMIALMLRRFGYDFSDAL